MKRKTLLGMVALCIFYMVQPSLGMAQNDPDIVSLYDQRQRAEAEYEGKKAQLEEEKRRLEEEISVLQSEKNRLGNKITRTQAVRFALFTFPKLLKAGPLSGIFMVLSRLSYYLLIATLIAIYIFSMRRPEIFFNYLTPAALSSLSKKTPIKREAPKPKSVKKVVFTIVILIILLLLAPGAFADDSIDAKAKEADRILDMSELEKSIKRLEKKATNYIDIDVSVSDANLKPWPRVRIDSPEYYYSLAALQYESGQSKYEQSLGYLLSRFDSSRLRDDKYDPMLMSVLRFFVERGDEDKIGIATGKIIQILSTERMYGLLDYLIAHNYYDIAKRPLDRIIYNERDINKLMALVDSLSAKGRITWSRQMLKLVIERNSGSSAHSRQLARFAAAKNMQDLRDTALLNALKSEKNTEARLSLLKQTVDMGAIDVAIRAAEELFNVSERNRLPMGTPTFGTPRILLLPSENVSLTAYLALLHHENGNNKKAASTLRSGIIHGLDTMINTVDADRDMILQSLICLRYINATAGKDFDSPELRDLYQNLKVDYIKQAKATDSRIASSRQTRLRYLQDKIDQAPSKQSSLQQEIGTLQFQAFVEAAKTSSAAVKLLVRFIMSFAFIYLSIVFGWEATLSVSENKTTVFIARAFEVYGIMLLFTITGIPFGLVLIFVNQLILAHIRACMRTGQFPGDTA